MCRKLCNNLLLFGFLFLVACRPDVDVATWNVDTLVPIAKARININDLVADSTVKVDPEGLVSVVFRNKIASLKPGEIAPPFNEVFKNTANIKSIDLGSRTISEQVTLAQMAANAGILGQLILSNHGNNQIIPPLTGLGPNSFNVDATQFFQSMTLRDGWMVLRMENGLPIELQNVQYEIGNSGSTPILQNTILSLSPNGVHYDSVRLQNNVTITGQLVATLISLDSPGSNGNPVLIDTTDAIDLLFTIDKLDPVSATAVFPAQNLVEDTATASIEPPSALLTKVHVQEGQIFMDATSTIDDAINLQYKIPGAIKNGVPLAFTEVIPAAPLGGSSQRRIEVPVLNYDIDLTGVPGSTNVFNEFYTVFVTRVDSSGRLINLSLTDSVYIETGIDELIANRGYGFLGYDSIKTTETTAINEFSNLQGGTLSLEAASLQLEIDNYIGANMDLRLLSAEAQSENTKEQLVWDDLGEVLTLGRATENTPGTRPQPQRTVFNLNQNNSNVNELLSLGPETFKVDLEAYMNNGVTAPDLTQFLYTEYGIDAFLNAEIPLNLSLENVSISDTQDFRYIDFDPKARLEGGSFKILAENFYPFAAEIDILLLNEQGQVLDTLQSMETLQAAKVDENGRAYEATESELEFPLDQAKIVRLKITTDLVFRVSFNTPPQAQAVKFYSDNYLDIQLVGHLSINTK